MATHPPRLGEFFSIDTWDATLEALGFKVRRVFVFYLSPLPAHQSSSFGIQSWHSHCSATETETWTDGQTDAQSGLYYYCIPLHACSGKAERDGCCLLMLYWRGKATAGGITQESSKAKYLVVVAVLLCCSRSTEQLYYSERAHATKMKQALHTLTHALLFWAAYSSCIPVFYWRTTVQYSRHPLCRSVSPRPIRVQTAWHTIFFSAFINLLAAWKVSLEMKKRAGGRVLFYLMISNNTRLFIFFPWSFFENCHHSDT